jgi:hypothetical protein
MKKCGLMAVMMVMMVIGSVAAAGASCLLTDKRGYEVYRGYDRPIGLLYVCTATGANTIADTAVSNMTGQLQSIDIVFKSPAPDSVTLTVKTVDGITAFTGSAVTSLATGRNRPDVPEGFPGGLIISQAGTFDENDVWWMILTFL